MQSLASKHRSVRVALTIGIPLAALVASYFWLPIIIDGIRSPHWPETRATVVSSGTRISEGRRARQVADVVYRYSVGSQSFTTNRYDQFGLLGSTGMGQRGSPADFVSVHPIGSELTIHYSPSRPAFSLIAAGFDVRHIMLVFVLGLLYWFSYYTLRHGIS